MRFLALLLLLSACAPRSLRIPGPLGPVGRTVRPPTPGHAVPPAEAPVPPPRSKQDARFEQAVTEAARHYLTHPLDGFRDDCSGFASAVFTRAGAPVEGSVHHLYELARAHDWLHQRRPQVGDLVFFDDTYDANRDGRTNDELTHVAVVLDVRPDGTVFMAHGGTGRGRTTLTMNLEHPSERHDPDGDTWNDWLRREKAGDPPGTRYFAGELFRAFATLEPADTVTASR